VVSFSDDFGLKILGVEPHIYKYFMRKNAVPEGEPIAEDKENDDQMKDILTKQPGEYIITCLSICAKSMFTFFLALVWH
jgi:hypothetical protein